MRPEDDPRQMSFEIDDDARRRREAIVEGAKTASRPTAEPVEGAKTASRPSAEPQAGCRQTIGAALSRVGSPGGSRGMRAG